MSSRNKMSDSPDSISCKSFAPAVNNAPVSWTIFPVPRTHPLMQQLNTDTIVKTAEDPNISPEVDVYVHDNVTWEFKEIKDQLRRNAPIPDISTDYDVVSDLPNTAYRERRITAEMVSSDWYLYSEVESMDTFDWMTKSQGQMSETGGLNVGKTTAKCTLRKPQWRFGNGTVLLDKNDSFQNHCSALENQGKPSITNGTNADRQSPPCSARNSVMDVRLSPDRRDQTDTCFEQTNTNFEQTNANSEQTNINSKQTYTHSEQSDINSSQTYTNSEQTNTNSEKTYTKPEQTNSNSEQTNTNSEQTNKNSKQTYTTSEQTYTNSEQPNTNSGQTNAHSEQTYATSKHTDATSEQTNTNSEETNKKYGQTNRHSKQTNTNSEQTNTTSEQTNTTSEQTYANSEQTYTNVEPDTNCPNINPVQLYWPMRCDLCGDIIATISCGQRFSQTTDSEEKLFKCELCQTEFTFHRRLRFHMLCHYKEHQSLCRFNLNQYDEQDYNCLSGQEERTNAWNTHDYGIPRYELNDSLTTYTIDQPPLHSHCSDICNSGDTGETLNLCVRDSVVNNNSLPAGDLYVHNYDQTRWCVDSNFSYQRVTETNQQTTSNIFTRLSTGTPIQEIYLVDPKDQSRIHVNPIIISNINRQSHDTSLIEPAIQESIPDPQQYSYTYNSTLTHSHETSQNISVDDQNLQRPSGAISKRKGKRDSEGNLKTAKRWTCNVCQKNLSVNSVYHHKLIHKGVKRHRCHICHKRYFRKDNLSRHKCVQRM